MKMMSLMMKVQAKWSGAVRRGRCLKGKKKAKRWRRGENSALVKVNERGNLPNHQRRLHSQSCASWGVGCVTEALLGEKEGEKTEMEMS